MSDRDWQLEYETQKFRADAAEKERDQAKQECENWKDAYRHAAGDAVRYDNERQKCEERADAAEARAALAADTPEPKRKPVTSTINHHNPDVTQVAAALADACHAGGLSDAYYRKADDALARLAEVLEARAKQLADALRRIRDDAGTHTVSARMPGELPPTSGFAFIYDVADAALVADGGERGK
jgi:hypothetical protein